MLRIPTLSPETSLLLSPRWGELSGPAQVAVLLLVCLLPVVLVAALYRYELRLIRRPVALGLLGLRLVVLTFLLFVLCLRPIVAHTVTEHLPGRVLVALDCSASMAIADPQRPAAEKLRLARALHLADDVCSPAQLDAWIQRAEERGEPQWVAPDESPNDPERRRQLTEERRRAYDQAVQRTDRLTRGEVARRVLAKDGLHLLDTLAARHRVDLLGFAQEAWDIKPEDLAEAGKANPDAKEGAVLNTDLRLPLARALERSGVGEGRVLGVVLLTDGQHNWGPSPVKQAIELGEHRLPVYPVALGTRQAPPDVALASVRSPAAVFKDVDAPIEARFKVSGLPAQDIVVELQRPGQPPLEEKIHHDGTDRYHTVRFQLRLNQVGPQTVTVTARPVAGEIRTDNNGQPLVINVADDRAKVLLVDGEARWEFHYLASALARDRTVQPVSVVFDQPRLGRISEEELAKIGNPRRTLPAEPDALADYDCIILGDVSPAELPPAERARLEKYVADRGGTLVVVAGKRSMPLAFPREPGGADAAGDPLAKLLPIEEPRAVRPAAGFPVALTHEGRLTPFLQLDESPDQSERRWADLPRHFWGVVGRAKPGAVPLAFVADEAPIKGKAAGAQEREQALIVRHNYGFGRVLFVGLDSTWRWRYKVGDAYHHRFWGQVVRWAAADKPLVAGNDYVRFGTREAVYRQGQEVDLVVRLGEEAGTLRPDSLAGARVVRQAAEGKPEEAVALAPLHRREAQPRVLEGQVRDLPVGHYAVELVIPELADKLHGPAGSDGRPTPLRATFTVTPPDSEEMVELATNWPLLTELAAKSGGQVFTPEDAGRLAELLTRQSATREIHSENRLWQWWGTLVLFLGLVTVEWVVRKWAGLP